MSLPFRYLGRRRSLDERLPDGRSVDEAIQGGDGSPFGHIVPRRVDTPAGGELPWQSPVDEVIPGLVEALQKKPDASRGGAWQRMTAAALDKPDGERSSWRNAVPGMIESFVNNGRERHGQQEPALPQAGGIPPGVLEAALRDGGSGNAPLLRNRPQEGSGGLLSANPNLIRPRRVADARDVSVQGAPVTDSLERADLRRRLPDEFIPSSDLTPRQLDQYADNAPYRSLSADSETPARTLLPRARPVESPSGNAPLLRGRPTDAANGVSGVNAPTNPVREPYKPLVDMGRPPAFGFDLKGKPVRAWRGDDLTTDLEYQRKLQNYKPKDRNGKLRSVLYGIAWALSRGGGGGNPWAALGSAITGGLIGGFHPQFDEEQARDYELASTDARIEKGYKRRSDDLAYQRGVADYQKTLAETARIKDEPERLRREAQQKSLEETRRTIAGFYNGLDEFDPDTDKELAAALREMGLPVTPKRGAQEVKVVQDERTGVWSVVTVNKRTGESRARQVRRDDNTVLVTTPRSEMTAAEKERDRASREGIARSNEAGRDRRASAKGTSGGMTASARRSLEIQADKLDAQAEAEDKQQRPINAQKYRQQAAAVRRQLKSGGSSQGNSAPQTFTADEVRARARKNGNDPEEAVKAARAAKILKE